MDSQLINLFFFYVVLKIKLDIRNVAKPLFFFDLPNSLAQKSTLRVLSKRHLQSPRSALSTLREYRGTQSEANKMRTATSCDIEALLPIPL